MGEARAQILLGMMYDKGKGVPQDLCGGCRMVSQGRRPGVRLGAVQIVRQDVLHGPGVPQD